MKDTRFPNCKSKLRKDIFDLHYDTISVPAVVGFHFDKYLTLSVKIL